MLRLDRGSIAARSRPDRGSIVVPTYGNYDGRIDTESFQRVSLSALRYRYVDAHAEAVREMDRPDPLIDLVIEPFAGLREHHFEGLSESLDAQLKMRQRMREAATQEAWSLNPDASSDSFDPDRVVMLLPDGEPLTASEPRRISETGPFLRRALVDRDPDLVEIYDDWIERFAQRPHRLNPVRKARARN